jgi:hypothetical protein
MSILSSFLLLIEHAYYTMYACLFPTSTPPDDSECGQADKQYAHTAHIADGVQARPIDHCSSCVSPETGCFTDCFIWDMYR